MNQLLWFRLNANRKWVNSVTGSCFSGFYASDKWRELDGEMREMNNILYLGIDNRIKYELEHPGWGLAGHPYTLPTGGRDLSRCLVGRAVRKL